MKTYTPNIDQEPNNKTLEEYLCFKIELISVNSELRPLNPNNPTLEIISYIQEARTIVKAWKFEREKVLEFGDR